MSTNKRHGLTRDELVADTVLLAGLKTYSKNKNIDLTSSLDLLEFILKLKDDSCPVTVLNSLLSGKPILKEIFGYCSCATTPSARTTRCDTQNGQPKPESSTASDAPFQGMSPHGNERHKPGTKHDSGKNRLDMVFGAFCRALDAVGGVGTYGADKYTDDGWLFVDDNKRRYADAFLRHYLSHKRGELKDRESNHTHLAHMVWNALAVLELDLREKEIDK